VVVFLPNDTDASANKHFADWLLAIKKQQIPVMLLGDLSYLKSDVLSNAFGLHVGEGATVKHIVIEQQSPHIGFEKKPDFERLGFFTLTSAQATQEWLTFKADDSKKQIAIGMTAWGGFAVSPNLFATGKAEKGYDAWLVDPYALFEQGLQLKPMPLPDVTTENGKRILMVHHDGDGFPSRAEIPGSPFAGKVLLDQIVKKYPIPMTMSVIEGEVSPTGLYPKDAPALEKIAREMFAQPNVEIASHTYSHPFSWAVVQGARSESNLYQVYNLAIPNYKPSTEREVTGSIDYVNRRLAPKNKKVKVIHWSGDCNPGKDALLMAEKDGVVSINGGETKETLSHDTLTKVGPVGLNKDGAFQVYAPNQNENVYTNDWTGPYYGFSRVIETFNLTESPRRIKPVDIYFHSYLVTKPAGLAALKTVFEWAMKQPLYPMVLSDYIRKAEDFNRVVVAKEGDRWHVRGLDHLKELRIPQAMGYPELLNSNNVIGFNDDQGMRYLHLIDNEADFQLVDTPPDIPYLVDANAAVTSFSRTPSGMLFKLAGHVPLDFTINASHCQVISHEGLFHVATTATSNQQYRSRHAAATVEAVCRP
jgi:hypothetical protein